MQRFRITAIPNSLDPSVDLRRLSDLRRDLYAHSPVEVDPDSPAHQTRRDERRQAYFELATDHRRELEDVIDGFGHRPFVRIEPLPGAAAEPCLRCGFVAEELTPASCPQCGLQDIAPCPNCHQPVSRQAYEQVAGNLFRCPECRHHVRLLFNDPIILPDGEWNEPVVLVVNAQPEPV